MAEALAEMAAAICSKDDAILAAIPISKEILRLMAV